MQAEGANVRGCGVACVEDEEDDAAHRLQRALKAWRGRGRRWHGRDRRLRRRPDGAARAEVVRRGGEPVDGGVDLLLLRVRWCGWCQSGAAGSTESTVVTPSQI